MAGNSNTINISLKLTDKGAVKAIQQVGTESKKAGATGSKSFDDMDASARKMGAGVDGATAAMTKMGKAAIAAAAAMAAMATVDTLRRIAEATLRMESMANAMTSITGTAGRAAIEMEFVSGTAQTLGLNLVSLEESYKGISAAAQGTALAGEPVHKIFTAVSEAAAVLGMRADETKGALNALSQMISKGNVQAEELRGQLGERLPGAFQIAAKAMGVSTQELGKLLETGKVLATDLLPKLADELHDRFGPAAEKAGDTARAAFERFGNAVEVLKRTIGESGIVEFMKDLAEYSAKVLETMSQIIAGPSVDAQIKNIEMRISILQAEDAVMADALARRAEQREQQLESLKRTFGGGSYNPVESESAKVLAQKKQEEYDSRNRTAKEIELELLTDQLTRLKEIQEQNIKNVGIDTSKPVADVGRVAKITDKQLQANLASINDLSEGQQLYLEVRTALEQEAHEEQLERIDEEYQAFKKQLDDKANAEEDALEEAERLRQKANEESQKAYEDFSDTVQGYTADIISDWDNAGDMLVDIAKRTAAEMAAAFLAEQFIIPMGLSVGSAMGLSWNGTSMSSMLGVANGVTGTGSGFSLPGSTALNWAQSNIPGMGWLGAAIPGTGAALSMAGGGASAGLLYPGAASGAVPAAFAPGITWGTALGAGAIGGLGYTLLGGSLGLPQNEWTGITSGLGSAGGFALGSSMASLGSLGGPIGIAVGAIAGGLLGGLFGGDDPDPKIKFGSNSKISTGMVSSNYNFGVNPDDMGNQEAVAEPVIAYFDAYFDAVDDQISISLKGVLEKAEFRADGNLSDYDDDVDAMLAAMTDGVFKDISGSLVEAMGLSSETFGLDFFTGIQAEGQDLFSTFVGFADMADSFSDFGGRINSQVSNGVDLTQAYANLGIIADMMALAETSLAAMGSSATISALETLVQTQTAYIDTMEKVGATTEELAKIQIATAQEMGAAITGLTADTVQSGIISAATNGTRIADAMMGTINASLAQTIAASASENIMAEYVAGLNQQVGEAVTASMTDGTLDAGTLSGMVTGIMDGFDWAGMENSVSAAVESVNAFIGATGSGLTAALQSAKSTYLAGLQSELSILESNFNSAKSEYLSLLRSEQTLLESNLNSAKTDYLNLLTEELNAQKTLASDLESAILSIQNYRKELDGFEESTSEDLLSQRDLLYAAVMNGSTESISDLIDVSRDYLTVAKASSSTALEYAIEVAKTNALMANVQENTEDQLTDAQQQIESLKFLISGVNGTTDAITDMDIARERYEAAQLELDGSGYATQIALLTDSKTLAEAQQEYNIAKSELDNNWYDAEIKALADIALSIQDLRTAYVEAVLMAGTVAVVSPGGGGSPLQFAEGGILSGPSSGYSVDATFHGIEAIVPLDRLDSSGLISVAQKILKAVSQLREESRAHSVSLIKSSQKVAQNTEYMEVWETIGMPTERV